MNSNLASYNSEEEKLNKVFQYIRASHLNDKEFSDYLENKANLFTMERINSHLEQCEFCRDEMQMLKDLSLEDPGELILERAQKNRKLLALIPLHLPASATKSGNRNLLEIVIAIFKYQLAALGTQGKATSEWAELLYSEDKKCFWTYREDEKRNLILKFTVNMPAPKEVHLKTSDQAWIGSLVPEGDAWIAEIIITAQERNRLHSGEDILISVIDK